MQKQLIFLFLIAGLVGLASADSYISNNYVDVRLSGVGNFGMGTTQGWPQDPQDDNKMMIYQWPNYSDTTFSSWYIDGTTNYYGTWPAGNVTEWDHVTIPDKQIAMTYEANDIVMRNIITLTDIVTGRFDTAEIKYVLKNTGRLVHQVGFRIMLDTMIGTNDGAPINVAGSHYSLFEQDYNPLIMPGYWYAYEFDISNPGLTAQGTIQGYNATRPDRFVVGYWPGVWRTVWDYNAVATQSYAPDSCTVMWYGPKPLRPGESMDIITYYGLVGLSTCDTAIQVSLVSPSYFKSTCDGETPFQVSMQIHNIQTVSVTDLQAVLVLDPGMEFVPSTLRYDKRHYPALAAGATMNDTWDVRLDSTVAGTMRMHLYVTGSPNIRCVVQRDIVAAELAPCTPTPSGHTPTPTPSATPIPPTYTPGGDTPTPTYTNPYTSTPTATAPQNTPTNTPFFVTSTPTEIPNTTTPVPTETPLIDTPTPATQPMILLAGYMGTNLTSSGGAMEFMALDSELAGGIATVECGLFFNGVDSGVRLTRSEAGVYSSRWQLTTLGGPQRFLIELQVKSASGTVSPFWPYLSVQ